MRGDCYAIRANLSCLFVEDLGKDIGYEPKIMHPLDIYDNFEADPSPYLQHGVLVIEILGSVFRWTPEDGWHKD